jgi:hypothetical protein
VLEYTERPERNRGRISRASLTRATFALQAHDPKSVVYYKNIRVKRLD